MEGPPDAPPAADVSFEDRQPLLAHKAGRVSTHYSAADISTLIEVSEKVDPGPAKARHWRPSERDASSFAPTTLEYSVHSVG
jgi:hypothetical protein